MRSENQPKKPMQLNYNKIKNEIVKAGFSVKEFSLAMDHSEGYLFAAERLNSMKVVDLCNICDRLNQPIQHFIDNNVNIDTSKDVLTEKEILYRILDTNKQILEQIKLSSKV